MSNVRTIYLDWNGGAIKSEGGPQLARQYDHLSNLVIFRNAPPLENYYLVVKMRATEDDLAPHEMEPIQLAGPYWLIPNVYTQLAQPVIFQVCCKTETGDFEHHSAKYTLNVIESLGHDGSDLEVDPTIMFDPYKQWVSDIAMAAGAIVIDPTLSVQGAAADAKAVGDYIMTDAEAVNLLAEASDDEERDFIGDGILSWLDDHPEAVVVQDGSITINKLAIGALGYVTPEMYGANGDGTTDDSDAIQAAIDSGYPVRFEKKTYLIESTVHLYNMRLMEFDASAATIIYTGDGYAFDLRAVRYCVLRFNSIEATNGGCLFFDGSVYEYWSQYINVYFNMFQAASTSACVCASETATWINEIRWHNGRMTRGLYGFRLIRNTPDHNMSHWNFYDIGIEGVTTGFSFESANDNSGKGLADFSFIGCRFEEGFTTLISSTGLAKWMTFYQSGNFPVNKVTTDSAATNWNVYGSDNDRMSLIDGQWIYEKRHYALGGGVPIPDSTDIDTFVNDGSYYCATNVSAATMTNCPTTRAFVLKVEERASDRYKRQTIIDYDGITYERLMNLSGSTWVFGSWVSDAWMDVSSSITHNTDVVTSGTLTLLYNAKYRMAVLSGNVAVSLSAGDNVIGTISTDYDAASYYVALNVSWDDVFPARIKNHTQINVHPSASYTGNIAVSGVWKV